MTFQLNSALIHQDEDLTQRYSNKNTVTVYKYPAWLDFAFTCLSRLWNAVLQVLKLTVRGSTEMEVHFPGQ